MTEKTAQAIIGFTMLIYFAVLIAGVVVMKRAMDYYKHEYQQCIIRQMPDSELEDGFLIPLENLDIGK